ATLGEQPQESVVEQAAQRHRHAQTLGRRQYEVDVLESEWRSESGRFKSACGDQSTIGLVGPCVEKTGREHVHEDVPIDVSLTDERDGLAQRLDGGGQ